MVAMVSLLEVQVTVVSVALDGNIFDVSIPKSPGANFNEDGVMERLTTGTSAQFVGGSLPVRELCSYHLNIRFSVLLPVSIRQYQS